MILVDTNVWSEATKADRNPQVMNWLRENDGKTLLSVLVIGEIEQGIAMTNGPDKRRVLGDWKRELIESHAGRIIDFDMNAALKWGALTAPFRRERINVWLIDVMLAAQAITLGVPLATRNAKDFRVDGITLIDPWNH